MRPFEKAAIPKVTCLLAPQCSIFVHQTAGSAGSAISPLHSFRTVLKSAHVKH